MRQSPIILINEKNKRQVKGRSPDISKRPITCKDACKFMLKRFSFPMPLYKIFIKSKYIGMVTDIMPYNCKAKPILSLSLSQHFKLSTVLKVMVLAIFWMCSPNESIAQLFYELPTPAQRKPKKQKEVPRFPPQFRSRDTIGQAQRKADSLAGIKNKVVIKKYQEVPDTIIKIISSKEDINGNVTTEKEIIVGTKHFFQISTMAGKLNRPFSADTINKDSITVQIIKKTHRLYVYHKHRFLTSYKCVFGPYPYLQKQFEGDKRTPEGWFKIKEVRNHDEWVKFMLLDYPNEESYKIFASNKKSGNIPEGKNIGGAIGIHGVAPGCDYFIDQKREWTDGCIALTRPDIEELSKILKAGTPVCIKLKNDNK